MKLCDRVVVSDNSHSLFNYVGVLIGFRSVHVGKELVDGYAWVDIEGIAGGTIIPLTSLKRVRKWRS